MSMTVAKFIFLLAIVILIVIFGVRNMHEVEINYYRGFSPQTRSIPLLYVILLSIFLGALFGWSTSIMKHIKLRMIIRKKEKEIKERDEELRKVRLILSSTSQDSIEENMASPSLPHDNDIK